MDNHVKTALIASLDKFGAAAGKDPIQLEERLIEVFSKDLGFLQKVEEFDGAFDEHPAFEELREVFFDLLMINFFASDVKKLEEDYLDSEEWADIEEETIDRGTELLNLLLYINECHDEKITPELDDFLKEFLLVEEDEFQDEFHIYEDLISNQQLVESSVEDICSHAGMIELAEEMEELFVPFMVFFHQPRANDRIIKDLETYSANKEFDVAVYTLIAAFNVN
ncbi:MULTISPECIES: hypothetical protein [Pedobacter]|uniref:Uncharacterized protein n=1 Tax=Pedobacter heparinus (strain ATCC 13125 / DSM 2366 / CIP 104194 / JCM 7457 / NBRC 12017 / NCIMB 9290 / NRRL B-14731 / HIM 762-3) TaxID=485917 RepID=C6Y3F4_PEDHD|nr:MULTISPECIES: hypothetical protein [Pedobacter]ACU05379.1 hypothetical protein Phep_3184 [Pedobacter heparinus DSM 2366]MBB5439470.1 hypothetical protein [Pedobacter sp. AK017]